MQYITCLISTEQKSRNETKWNIFIWWFSTIGYYHLIIIIIKKNLNPKWQSGFKPQCFSWHLPLLAPLMIIVNGSLTTGVKSNCINNKGNVSVKGKRRNPTEDEPLHIKETLCWHLIDFFQRKSFLPSNISHGLLHALKLFLCSQNVLIHPSIYYFS